MNWIEANRDFYESGVWASVVLGGLHVKKYPTDLYVYEEIITRTKPEVIVETGSFEGGSALWFSRFAEVVSIDKFAPPNNVEGVTFIQGDSVEVAADLPEVLEGRSVLVSLDSDHNAEHVLAELEVYAPLATDYIVVEDTAVDAYELDAAWYPEGGPGRAVERFLRQTMGWAPDPECDRFLLGMNPGGWLRRAS